MTADQSYRMWWGVFQPLGTWMRGLERKRALFFFKKLTEIHGAWNSDMGKNSLTQDVESCTFYKAHCRK